MVLVDTSVWVDHLRLGNSALTELLSDAKAVSHPFVVGELACGNLRNRMEVLSLLQSLPSTHEVSHEELLRFIEGHRLMGQGLGLIDVHLLASARLAAIPLWTLDRRLREAATALDVAYRQFGKSKEKGKNRIRSVDNQRHIGHNPSITGNNGTLRGSGHERKPSRLW